MSVDIDLDDDVIRELVELKRLLDLDYLSLETRELSMLNDRVNVLCRNVAFTTLFKYRISIIHG